MKNYCFIRETLLDDFKDEYELQSGAVLTEKANLGLNGLQYSNRCSQNQSDLAHEGFSKRDAENAVRLVGSIMTPGAHEHIISSDLMFHQWNRSLRAAKKKIENVEADSERGKERESEVFEVEDPALLYTKRSRFYKRDPRRRHLLHASVLKMGTHIWRKEET